MREQSFLGKMAKAAFEKDAVFQSWEVHRQAFGPILEPAFVENYPARIHLTAALNRYKDGDIKGGMKKLQQVEKLCETDADWAALLFCVGLGAELSGNKEIMLLQYQRAGALGHNFYLPYLKCAKEFLEGSLFEAAEKAFLRAIECLKQTEMNDQNKVILASAYTNYGSCLTMMHRFEEAEQAFDTSIELLAVQPVPC